MNNEQSFKKNLFLFLAFKTFVLRNKAEAILLKLCIQNYLKHLLRKILHSHSFNFCSGMKKALKRYVFQLSLRVLPVTGHKIFSGQVTQLCMGPLDVSDFLKTLHFLAWIRRKCIQSVYFFISSSLNETVYFPIHFTLHRMRMRYKTDC